MNLSYKIYKYLVLRLPASTNYDLTNLQIYFYLAIVKNPVLLFSSTKRSPTEVLCPNIVAWLDLCSYIIVKLE